MEFLVNCGIIKNISKVAKQQDIKYPLLQRALQWMSKKIVNSQYVNRWYIFAFDVIVASLITFFTYVIVGFLRGGIPHYEILSKILILSLSASIITFLSTGIYRGLLRHTTSSEIWRLSVASIIKTLLEAIFIIFFLTVIEKRINLNITRIITIEFLCACLLMSVLSFARVFIVYIYNYSLTKQERERRNVLVYEIENRSIVVQQYLDSYRRGKYNVCGFIKMSDSIKKQILVGKKIFYISKKEYFVHIVKKYNINAIVFPSEVQVTEQKDNLVDLAINLGLKIFVFPNVSELSGMPEGKISMREIKIEDLLGREELGVDMSKIEEFLKGKRVLITGAAGSIGSELSRLISKFDISRLVMLDCAETPMHNLTLEFEQIVKDYRLQLQHKEGLSEKEIENLASEFSQKFSFYMCDVRSIERLESAFIKFKPQIIFHAAAYKHVPMMELNPTEAVRVNVYGTKNVANMAIKYDAEKMIMVSTDKAVNPTNVMGASKRIAEIYTQSLSVAVMKGDIKGKTKFITTRFGNVLGSNGSVIPRFKEQIAKGGPVTVTHKDIVRYFMSIPEACRLVLEASTLGQGYEIFVFDMGKPVKITELAEKMIRLAGYEPEKDIKIVYTGLRPGEKLYEELLYTKENTIPTSNKKIFVAKVKEYEFNVVEEKIEKLLELAKSINLVETVKLMKEIVPEFKSKNSVYEQLDKIENFNAL